ncbi:hypothetical protein CDAR_522561 [Caerostris darwini]|uniref:Uncharacterized protein n=1 Tax=Caerostris darwini TaxID=1538125 RepID=A0AAV4VQD3_9ARAC|nr:hypothetical protein CDAR_522561 [Caerostris darwini]
MMESSANGTTELHSNLRYENSCNAIESENIVDCKQENNLIPTHSLIQEETNCSNLYTGTESIESSDFENLKDPVMADSFSQNQSQPDSSASSSRARSSENCIERTQIENDSNPNVEIINTTTPEKTDASYEKDYNLKKLSVKLTRAKVHSVSYGWTFLKQLASDVYNDFYKQNKRIDLKKIYKLNIVSPYTSLTRTVFQHRLSYLLNKLIRENIKKEREEKRLCIRGKIVRLNSKLDSATRLSLHSSYSEVHLTRDRKIERKFRKTKTNKKNKTLRSRKAIQATVAKAPRRLVQPRRHSVVNQPSCSFSRPDRMPSRQEPKELKVCDPKVTHRPILHIPQPEQPSPIPSTSFHIPQPEQLNSSPQPSTDFQISLPEQLSSSPQPPTKQPSSSPKPEQLSSSPNPFIDFQISQLEQLSSSPQPNTNFQIPQPEQLSSSPNPSIDFGISQPEQLSSSPIPSTSYQIRQLEQLGSSPQPPTNFQNYSMDHLSLSGLNHLPINAKSSAANKSFYLGNDKTEMDNDSDNTELFQLSQKPLFAITSLC